MHTARIRLFRNQEQAIQPIHKGSGVRRACEKDFCQVFRLIARVIKNKRSQPRLPGEATPSGIMRKS